jgi:hypothetical protein
MLNKMVVYFGVSRNGLFLTGFRIDINVVFRSPAMEFTSGTGELTDERLTFHIAIAF